MEINLLSVLNYDGKKIDVSEDVSISATSNDGFRLLTPVHFDGYVVNIGGTIELHGSASATVSSVCDRCTEEFDFPLNFEINESYKRDDGFTNVDEDSDIVLLEGSVIDLDELLYMGIILNLPSKSLCSEDCKGLCPVCGKNLNYGECDCENENTDPRFDILDKLL